MSPSSSSKDNFSKSSSAYHNNGSQGAHTQRSSFLWAERLEPLPYDATDVTLTDDVRAFLDEHLRDPDQDDVALLFGPGGHTSFFAENEDMHPIADASPMSEMPTSAYGTPENTPGADNCPTGSDRPLATPEDSPAHQVLDDSSGDGLMSKERRHDKGKGRAVPALPIMTPVAQSPPIAGYPSSGVGDALGAPQDVPGSGLPFGLRRSCRKRVKPPGFHASSKLDEADEQSGEDEYKSEDTYDIRNIQNKNNNKRDKKKRAPGDARSSGPLKCNYAHRHEIGLYCAEGFHSKSDLARHLRIHALHEALEFVLGTIGWTQAPLLNTAATGDRWIPMLIRCDLPLIRNGWNRRDFSVRARFGYNPRICSKVFNRTDAFLRHFRSERHKFTDPEILTIRREWQPPCPPCLRPNRCGMIQEQLDVEGPSWRRLEKGEEIPRITVHPPRKRHWSECTWEECIGPLPNAPGVNTAQGSSHSGAVGVLSGAGADCDDMDTDWEDMCDEDTETETDEREETDSDQSEEDEDDDEEEEEPEDVEAASHADVL